MAFQVAIPNMSKGEIAPALYGRIDTNQYQAALRKCRNFIVQRYGGVTFRPGTRIVGKVDDPTKPIRLAPFQFSIDQAYALLLQQGSMRPMALGGFVVEQNTQITAATNAPQCTLTIPYHGYSVGDRIFLSGITGMTEINGQTATVLSVPDANSVVIDIDTRQFGAFIGSNGTLNTSAPTPPPPDIPVPPPVTPPVPPSVGGGGGNYVGGGGSGCPVASALVLLDRGEAKPAGEIVPGVDRVWTMHETTGEWGAYLVTHKRLLLAELWDTDGRPLTSGSHLWREGEAWARADSMAKPVGLQDTVVALTVEDAHTYVLLGDDGSWHLSHNKTVNPEDS